MTVRAKPQRAWLGEMLDVGAAPRSGMVTSLHLDENGVVVGYGHNLGNAGESFDFGEGLSMAILHHAVSELPNPSVGIWGPCSGGALYRVAALRRARKIVGRRELIRRRGFKSYNCDAMAYVVRAAGFVHRLAPKAICRRDRSESTSKIPSSCGLLMNQEINRIANLFDYWPADLRKSAIKEYLDQDRRTKSLTPVDRSIARTLGEGLARPRISSKVRAKVESALRKHLMYYPDVKAVRKRLLNSTRVQRHVLARRAPFAG